MNAVVFLEERMVLFEIEIENVAETFQKLLDKVCDFITEGYVPHDQIFHERGCSFAVQTYSISKIMIRPEILYNDVDDSKFEKKIISHGSVKNLCTELNELIRNGYLLHKIYSTSQISFAQNFQNVETFKAILVKKQMNNI